MSTLTGADVLVRRLKEHGVRHVFGYPGGQLTPLYDAIYRDGEIRHVLARDEQAAGFMADGYARATGRPGLVATYSRKGVAGDADQRRQAHPVAGRLATSLAAAWKSCDGKGMAGGSRSGRHRQARQVAGKLEAPLAADRRRCDRCRRRK